MSVWVDDESSAKRSDLLCKVPHHRTNPACHDEKDRLLDGISLTKRNRPFQRCDVIVDGFRRPDLGNLNVVDNRIPLEPIAKTWQDLPSGI